MTRKILWMLLSFLLVASLVLTSCAKEEVVVPGEQEEEEEEIEVFGFPRSETVIAQQLTERNATPNNFNMWAGWRQRDRGMQQLMNEPLYMDDFDGGKIHNTLAIAPPEYNEGFTQLTIKLREGVYWSDGVEFTADDVVFTIEFLTDTPGAIYNAILAKGVKNVYAPDRYTVVIELLEPNPRFHIQNFVDLWGSMWIMPKHVFQQFVVDGVVATEDFFAFEYNPPLSLGPYVLHSYDETGFWTAWERRDDWERTPTGMLHGKPAPRYVVFNHFGDFTARVIAQTRHEVDMIDLNLPAIIAAIKANPYAHGYWADRDFPYLLAARHPSISGATYNALKPPFDNRDVRWALTLAIDIVSYITTTHDGGSAMNPFLMGNAPMYQEPYIKPLVAWCEDFTLEIGDGKQPATFKPWDPDAPFRLVEKAWERGFEFSDDPELIRATFGHGWWKYAPDIATRLLEKHGFSRDAKGKWLLPDGTPWKINILTAGTPGRWAYQNAMATYVEWKRFGLDVIFEIADPGMLKMAHGDFDVTGDGQLCAAWYAHPDWYAQFALFHSDYLEPVLGEYQWGHPSRWTHPRMDELLDELKGTHPDDTARIEPLTLEIVKLLIEEMPMTPGSNTLDPYTVDTYHWTGWPSAENPYITPYHHYPTFKILLTHLEPTGR